VSQAEGVHHVCLVDSGAQLGRAAQPTGHAVVPVEVTVVLHIGSPAEEGGQHDLAAEVKEQRQMEHSTVPLPMEKKGSVFSATKWSS
jgi:hypothetical protein